MSAPLAPETFMRKAEAALAGARVLLKSGDFDGACSRAYYAMFDAAHAALFAIGVVDIAAPIKTHNGLIAMFGQHLVRGNHIAAEHGANLNKVRGLRELADYSGEPVGKDMATWALDQADACIVAVKTVLAKAH